MLNTIRKLFLGVALALFIVILGGGPARACDQWVYTPTGQVCLAPSPPVGWTLCAAGYIPVTGEVAIFTGANFSGFCAKRMANYDSPSLGDFDGGSGGGWRVMSIRTAAVWYVQFWDGTNYTGSTTILVSGSYAASMAWSSVKIRN